MMAETVSIELPDVGDVVRRGKTIAVGRYSFSAANLGALVENERKYLAHLEAAFAFVEAERRSQRAEEAAKIIYAEMNRPRLWSCWDVEPAGVHKGYKSAAKALLEAVDNGTL